MEKAGRLADVAEYLALSKSERDAIIKARIGQGGVRQSLIEYWSSCAVTGCANTQLLRASHIKPWKVADLKERLSLYNGLLLSPALDACFDAGYISFDDQGKCVEFGWALYRRCKGHGYSRRHGLAAFRGRAQGVSGVPSRQDF